MAAGTVATVAGLVGAIDAPNLNPDSAGVEAIFVEADKSLSFDMLDDLTPNENVVAVERRKCVWISKNEQKRKEFYALPGRSLFVFSLSFSLLWSPNENVFTGPSVTLALD